MLFLLKDMYVTNYADENIESVIKSLEQSANLLFSWFKKQSDET